mgnify:CR=1 FL=1
MTQRHLLRIGGLEDRPYDHALLPIPPLLLLLSLLSVNNRYIYIDVAWLKQLQLWCKDVKVALKLGSLYFRVTSTIQLTKLSCSAGCNPSLSRRRQAIESRNNWWRLYKLTQHFSTQIEMSVWVSTLLLLYSECDPAQWLNKWWAFVQHYTWLFYITEWQNQFY